MNARLEAELRNRAARARLGLLEEPSSPVDVELCGGSVAGGGSSSGPLTEAEGVVGPDTPTEAARHPAIRGQRSASVSGDRSMRHWALLYDKGVAYRKPFDGRCVFCGHRCYGRVCQWHRDLVQLETEAH